MRANTTLSLQDEDMRRILFFLFLVSLSFSSLLWQVDIRGEPLTKPLSYQDNFVIASSDQNIYAINPASGKYTWKANVGSAVDVIEFGGKLIALTKNGTVIAIDKTGKTIWTVDLKKVNQTLLPSEFYGLGKNSKNVYATTNIGVYKITENSASLFYTLNGTYGKPAVDENYMLITADNSLIKIDMNGKQVWEKDLNTKIWQSVPVLEKNAIYFGALDNKFYAIRPDGYEIFTFYTGGWIRTTPLVKGDYIYFGSDDTYVYKIDKNGELIWKAKIGLATSDQPTAGILGDKEVIFVSSGDGGIYAIDDKTGEILWESSKSGGIATQPIFYQNKIAFASYDKNVYVYTTNRGCSITSPKYGEIVGHKEVVVKGKSISTTGQQKVFITINGGEWLETEIDDKGDWVYYLDPQKDLQEGINTISCRVEDISGSEQSPYTTVAISRNSNIPLDDFIVSIPNQPFEKEPFEIYVNSKSDGSPVERFTLSINGQEYKGDKKVELTLEAGSYDAIVKKIGYNDAKIRINVNSKGINPIYIAAGIAILLVIVWFVYSRLIKK